MIDHVSVAVSDLDAATGFYRTVLAPIGMVELVSGENTMGFGKVYPEFWLNARPRMAKVVLESGAHIFLRCPSNEAVIAFHEAALARGGSDAGVPRERDGVQTRYFGAFILDLDGNKIEAVAFPRETS